MSALGRANYAMHLIMYPLIGVPTYYGYKSYSANAAAAQAKEDEK